MAEEKKESKPKAPAKKDASSELAEGADEVQAAVDEATEQGFYGERSDPFDPEEWSLESGPDSPSAEDVRVELAKDAAEPRR